MNKKDIDIIENEMLFLHREVEKYFGRYEKYKKAILHLLRIRKQLLDSYFVMDEYHLRLLSEFNECLKKEISSTYHRTKHAFQMMVNTEENPNVNARGKVFLTQREPLDYPYEDNIRRTVWIQKFPCV